MKRSLLLSYLFTICSPILLFANYEIKGTVNLSDNWQRQIFFATVSKLDDYYKANPADIIQVGVINEDGSFIIQGDNLPLEKRFYRLYLIKEENSEFDACLYAGDDDHNFVHLIMDNETQVEIHSDQKHFAPFGKYTIEGDQENQSLAELSHLIFPSFYFYQIKFPSELQFTESKLNRDLFDFAERTEFPLVGLAALFNTDMDEYFPLEHLKYESFGEKLKKSFPNHNYTNDYYRKLLYHSGDYTSTSTPNWIYYLLAILLVGLILAIRKINILQRKLIEKEPKPKANLLVKLSNQEEKILHLILEEKSNKEIASSLFIELSTVKTHINKLYSKLEVKNRAEAKLKAKNYLIQGV